MRKRSAFGDQRATLRLHNPIPSREAPARGANRIAHPRPANSARCTRIQNLRANPHSRGLVVSALAIARHQIRIASRFCGRGVLRPKNASWPRRTRPRRRASSRRLLRRTPYFPACGGQLRARFLASGKARLCRALAVLMTSRRESESPPRGLGETRPPRRIAKPYVGGGDM